MSKIAPAFTVFASSDHHTVIFTSYRLHQTGSVLRRLIVAFKKWSPTHTHTHTCMFIIYYVYIRTVLVKLWQFRSKKNEKNQQHTAIIISGFVCYVKIFMKFHLIHIICRVTGAKTMRDQCAVHEFFIWPFSNNNKTLVRTT